MGYVRTREEIKRIQDLARRAIFTIEGVSVEFETTAEFARSVLPPCLDFDEPGGIVTVSRWQSAVCGEFGSTAVMLKARWKEFVGTYFLTLLVSGDMPVAIGREFWGEPKKRGESHFFRDAENIYAFGERNGVRLVQIDATFTKDLGHQTVKSHALEVSGPLAHDASLAGDPFVAAFLTSKSGHFREGTAELLLTGSPFDPVDDIPVLSTGRALHYTGESSYEEIAREYMPDRDTYLPYILGRSFDDLSQFRVPLRHRAGNRQDIG